MKLKNNLGQALTLSTLRSIWHDSGHDYGMPPNYTRKEWLAEKAMDTYYQRVAKADAIGANIDGINAQDVRYTILDEIKRQAWNTRIGKFAVGLYHWLADEPDYSRLYPYG